MVENYVDVRHIQKHETEANWLTLAPNFIPKRGEIIVYDVDENYNYERMKIGDGLTSLKDLPFANGSEIDVATDEDVLALLATQDIVTPVVDATGAIYTDKNQNILTI